MTSPFPASVLARLESTSQAVKWAAILKETREFRAYCCDIDTDAIMGVAKEPVVIADISPGVVCLGEAISWDISDSYAPGSTLTGWTIDFGDEVGSTGGADFPNDDTSGAYVYGETGTFTIEIEIEEGLGKTQTSSVEVTVVSCGETLAGESWSYLSTDGGGIFVIDWTEASPEWTAINGGLSGDALYVRHFALTPASRELPQSLHVLWAATKAGIFKTEDGGNSWGQIVLPDPSNLQFLDDPAAAVDELDWRTVVFDPKDENTVYILASKVDS